MTSMDLRPLRLSVCVSPALTSALGILVCAAQRGLPAAFLEHVREDFERPGDLICAVAFDANDAPAVPAGEGGVLLEPADALLELAAASGAGNFDETVAMVMRITDTQPNVREGDVAALESTVLEARAQLRRLSAARTADPLLRAVLVAEADLLVLRSRRNADLPGSLPSTAQGASDASA